MIGQFDLFPLSDIHLFLHNTLFLSGGLINIVLAGIVLFIKRKSINSLTVTFILMMLSVATFQITQVFGANALDADMSRRIFMFNLCVIPIQVFMTHWFLALIGKVNERRLALGAVYASGLILLCVSIVFPYAYLVESVPKMYLPFYYEPGSLQWLVRVWFHVVGAYYFIELLVAYHTEVDPIKKNRYLFVLFAVLYGFLVGETAVLLVYDIPFDPLWSSFFGLFTVFLVYAMLRYQLFDVRFIVRRSFMYALLVSIFIGFIIFADYSNNLIQNVIPGFPTWVAPFGSSVLAVAIGFFLWRKFRENDMLKYEFITVIAHKFRTPLTESNWAAEDMLSREKDADNVRDLKQIVASNNKLVSLTSALIDLADTDSTADSSYRFKKTSLEDVVSSMADSYPRILCSKGHLFFH